MKTSIDLAIVVCCCVVSACSGESSRQPASPTTPTVARPSDPSSAGGFSLSGVIYENTSTGRQPIPGGEVVYWLDTIFGGRAKVDINGSYTIPGLAGGSFVRLTWESFGSGLVLHQPWPANATVVGDTVRDIELARIGCSLESPHLLTLFASCVDIQMPSR